MENAKKILGDKVMYAKSSMEAAKDADAVAILTEWPEFSEVNLVELKSVMRTPKIVDLRNMLKSKHPETQGFEYQCIGMSA